MKVAPILEYTADDGTIFKDEDACLEHERKGKAVAKIMQPLGSSADDCGFSNGDGWIQHKPKTVETVKVELCKYVQKFIKHKWLDQTIAEPHKCHASWVGRLLDDHNDRVFYKAWGRLMCIDEKTGREYGQPYFAMHPEEAKGKAIKPIRKKA